MTTAVAIACVHCGLPGRSDDSPVVRDMLWFCCGGCAAVYDILHSAKLDAFYDVRRKLGVDHAPEPVHANAHLERAYPLMDSSEFADAHVHSQSDGLCSVRLRVPSMHCGACVWLLERAPKLVPGLVSLTADLPRRSVQAIYDPKSMRISSLAQRMASMGYGPYPFDDDNGHQAAAQEERRLLIDMAIAGGLAGNIMLMSFALWDASFYRSGDPMMLFFRIVAGTLAALALIFPGRRFLKGGWLAMRMGHAHMDIPIALGLIAAWVLSAVQTVRGAQHVYFDSVVGLVFFLLIGRWVYHRQATLAQQRLMEAHVMMPRVARVVQPDGTTVDTSPQGLRVNDIVRLCAGDECCGDGVVLVGEGDVDASVLTGESHAVPVHSGSVVRAGMLLLRGTADMRITALGEHTWVGALLTRMREQQHDKGIHMRFADQASGTFVILVIVAALIAWWVKGFIVALTLLICACPCALALAMPLVAAHSLARAALHGILIKRPAALEVLSSAHLVIALDKTGTLTSATRHVLHAAADDPWHAYTQALAMHSSHSASRTLAQFVSRSTPTSVAATDVQEITGQGMQGRIHQSMVRLGRPTFACDTLPAWATEQMHAHHDGTPVVLSVDGVCRAVYWLSNTLRPESAAMVAWMQQHGHEVFILSGDGTSIVHSVGRMLGLQDDACVGDMTPEDKEAFVQRYKNLGRQVVMIGDGVNDATALAQSHCGVAVSGGASASLQAADVYLAHGITSMVPLFRGARSTLWRVKATFAYAAVYNVFAAWLAWIGWITPLWAAVFMPTSSLVVVAAAFLPSYNVYKADSRFDAEASR